MNSLQLYYNSHSHCYMLYRATSDTHTRSTNNILQVIFFFLCHKNWKWESRKAFYKNIINNHNELLSPTNNKAHRSNVSLMTRVANKSNDITTRHVTSGGNNFTVYMTILLAGLNVITKSSNAVTRKQHNTHTTTETPLLTREWKHKDKDTGNLGIETQSVAANAPHAICTTVHCKLQRRLGLHAFVEHSLEGPTTDHCVVQPKRCYPN